MERGKRLRQIGSALILAAVVLGPGSVTLSITAGSRYGAQLVWVPVLAGIFMIVYTWMSARVALVSRRSLFDLTRRKFGRWPAWVGGVCGFLAILAFQSGNSAAVGFTLSVVFGVDTPLAAFLCFLPAVWLLFLPQLYSRLEFLVKLVVAIMVIGFAGTLAIVGMDLPAVGRGLIPQFPDGGAVFLALGLSATTFSVAAAAYQGYLLRQKHWDVNRLAAEGLDVLVGIGILALISIIVLLTSAAVHTEAADEVFTPAGLAQQLAPLYGDYAYALFLSGFFFAAFSSLVVNPLIGAALLLDGVGRLDSLDSPSVRWTAAGIMSLGLAVVLIAGRAPIELIRAAQAMAVVGFPVLGFLIWNLARDEEIMGDQRNSRWVDALAVSGYVMLLLITLNYLRVVLA